MFRLTFKNKYQSIDLGLQRIKLIKKIINTLSANNISKLVTYSNEFYVIEMELPKFHFIKALVLILKTHFMENNNYLKFSKEIINIIDKRKVKKQLHSYKIKFLRKQTINDFKEFLVKKGQALIEVNDILSLQINSVKDVHFSTQGSFNELMIEHEKLLVTIAEKYRYITHSLNQKCGEVDYAYRKELMTQMMSLIENSPLKNRYAEYNALRKNNFNKEAMPFSALPILTLYPESPQGIILSKDQALALQKFIAEDLPSQQNDVFTQLDFFGFLSKQYSEEFSQLKTILGEYLFEDLQSYLKYPLISSKGEDAIYFNYSLSPLVKVLCFGLSCENKIYFLNRLASEKSKHQNNATLQLKNIDIPDTSGRFPMSYAISTHDMKEIEYIRVLLKNGALPYKFTKDSNYSIFKAIDGLSQTKVKLLLEYTPDLNIKDCQNQSILHYAIDLKKNDVISALIEHKDVLLNEPDIYGNTPLHKLAGEDDCCLNIFEALLKKLKTNHESLDLKNNQGLTPLHVCISKSNNIKMQNKVQLLCQNKADVNATDSNNLTCLLSLYKHKTNLTLSECRERLSVAKILWKYDSIKDKNNLHLLLIIAGQGDYLSLKFFIKEGIIATSKLYYEILVAHAGPASLEKALNVLAAINVSPDVYCYLDENKNLHTKAVVYKATTFEYLKLKTTFILVRNSKLPIYEFLQNIPESQKTDYRIAIIAGLAARNDCDGVDEFIRMTMREVSLESDVKKIVIHAAQCFAFYGFVNSAYDYVKKMDEKYAWHTRDLLNNIGYSLARTGMKDVITQFLKLMEQDYKSEITHETFTYIAHGYIEADYENDAYDLFEFVEKNYRNFAGELAKTIHSCCQTNAIAINANITIKMETLNFLYNNVGLSTFHGTYFGGKKHLVGKFVSKIKENELSNYNQVLAWQLPQIPVWIFQTNIQANKTDCSNNTTDCPNDKSYYLANDLRFLIVSFLVPSMSSLSEWYDFANRFAVKTNLRDSKKIYNNHDGNKAVFFKTLKDHHRLLAQVEDEKAIPSNLIGKFV